MRQNRTADCRRSSSLIAKTTKAGVRPHVRSNSNIMGVNRSCLTTHLRSELSCSCGLVNSYTAGLIAETLLKACLSVWKSRWCKADFGWMLQGCDKVCLD